MRTKEELTREVEDRNKLRAEVGLSLVPVAKEVQKLYAAELRQDFLDWSDRNSDIRLRIEAEMLEAERRDRHDPTWRPRALLNGAWAFGSKVQDWMRKIWREERKRAATHIDLIGRRVCLTPSAC